MQATTRSLAPLLKAYNQATSHLENPTSYSSFNQSQPRYEPNRPRVTQRTMDFPDQYPDYTLDFESLDPITRQETLDFLMTAPGWEDARALQLMQSPGESPSLVRPASQGDFNRSNDVAFQNTLAFIRDHPDPAHEDWMNWDFGAQLDDAVAGLDWMEPLVEGETR
jgi:hypothetical protein